MTAGSFTPNHIYDGYIILIYVFGSLHLLLSIWMVMEYFLLNWSSFVIPSSIYTTNLVSGIRKYIIIHYSYNYDIVYV